MKTLIIDGYNVIHKIPELSTKLDESLAAARSSLAMHISNWRTKHPYERIHIVFDGQDDATLGYPKTALHGVECSFTRTKEDADDRILSIIRKSKNPLKITVVSDDNRIRNNCRAHGAEVKSASFLTLPAQKLSKPKRLTSKAIDTKQNKDITAYYSAHLKQRGRI